MSLKTDINGLHKRISDLDEYLKGYPEFNVDQPRGADGRWGGGGGSSSARARDRRNFDRQAEKDLRRAKQTLDKVKREKKPSAKLLREIDVYQAAHAVGDQLV